MKTISCLRHLEDYGIVPLTGEADGLMFRCLCDLTEKGVAVVTETLGLPTTTQFFENMNGGKETDPHVASMMIGYEDWKSYAIVALLQAGCHTVIETKDNVIHGLGEDERYFPETGEMVDGQWKMITEPALQIEGFQYLLPLYGLKRTFGKSTHPGTGFRNTHTMSGRTH